MTTASVTWLYDLTRPWRLWQRPSQLVNLYADPLVDYYAFGHLTGVIDKWEFHLPGACDFCLPRPWDFCLP